eukprot:TRINITY_DN15083_c0_g1_i1.p1 TRINITY_DN15083_c0_g1~~TRINITY_DN15083_c0_g1_i1.p1  ORF type:complete len:355 (+),score=69.26 TRINITY_DN15083_c0_g1_i1:51-1067(+)
MTTLRRIASLSGHGETVWDVAWSPSGDLLASCSGDKSIRLWSRQGSGEDAEWVCRAVLEDAHQRTVRRLAWSPSGSHLAAASFDGTTSVWCKRGSSSEFECIATLEGHENEVKSVAWHEGGALLATCSRDKSVWIWEMEHDEDFECVSVLHGHSQDVKAVEWQPNREMLFSVSYDNDVKMWMDDEDDWFCASTLRGHDSTVWDLSFCSDGTRMVTAGDDQKLVVWEETKEKTPEGCPVWKQSCTVQGHHTRCVYSVDWSHIEEEGMIATGAGDDCIRVFARRTEGLSTPNEVSFDLVATMEKAHDSDVNCVRWHPKEKGLLASCGDDRKVNIFRLVDA